MGIPYAEVIGDPIAHSKSPLIHNFWLRKLGIEAEYRARRITAEELATYFHARGADPDWIGCNVTLPHKQSILPLLDRLSPEAAKVGAANIVSRQDTALVGYNSDGAGFLEPLRPLLDQPHLMRMARIFGAGGAARAVAHALAAHSFILVIAARQVEQARAVIAAIGGEHHAVALSHFAQSTDFCFDDREGVLDLVINATPAGMHGQAPFRFDWSHVPPRSIVYDLVYAPLETALLAEAGARGHRIIDGLHMLIGQAAVAFQMFFGKRAPREHDAELRSLLRS
jgi:shikimate dehydrogenase